MTLNETHAQNRESWVPSAQDPHTDFPLQNLPFGVFKVSGEASARIGVAIGSDVLDLQATAKSGLLPLSAGQVVCEPNLNRLMEAGPETWHALRSRLSELLGADSCAPAIRAKVQECIIPQRNVAMLLPAHVGGYTDFYASRFHATRVGELFRPSAPLLPNYQWVPVGYHGRASSVVASGSPIKRPKGQYPSADSPAPLFRPTASLDYEVELGAFVGPGNALGEPIELSAASSHLFGVVLLNDWSARDLQAWEYQPLGPFLGKNFATTISPWVVTTEALAPFRSSLARPAGAPAPLPYLSDVHDAAHGALDLTLEAFLQTPSMRTAGEMPHRLSVGNFRDMYWTLAQLLTHHTSNGCNLQPGDLLGSGTVSGPSLESRGCLLELTARGIEPIRLPGGEERRYLEDGDEIILRGHAEGPGFRRIGLGECRGRIMPAR